MFKILKKNKFLQKGNILLAVLCTQVFPYIHFHHTHVDNHFSIIVSSHPIDHENSHHSEQHDGEHHHEAKVHIVADWNYIKTVSDSPLKDSVNLDWITQLTFDEKYTHNSIVNKEQFHTPSNKILLLPDLSRGPPALLS